MSIEIQYHTHPEYLLVKVSGQWTDTAAKQALDEIRTEADRRGFKRLLLDLRDLSQPDYGMTRFWSGKHLAEVLPYPFKVAAFAKPEAITKFGETAAVNRGAWFLIFSEERMALRWLMEESSKTLDQTFKRFS